MLKPSRSSTLLLTTALTESASITSYEAMKSPCQSLWNADTLFSHFWKFRNLNSARGRPGTGSLRRVATRVDAMLTSVAQRRHDARRPFLAAPSSASVFPSPPSARQPEEHQRPPPKIPPQSSTTTQFPVGTVAQWAPPHRGPHRTTAWPQVELAELAPPPRPPFSPPSWARAWPCFSVPLPPSFSGVLGSPRCAGAHGVGRLGSSRC